MNIEDERQALAAAIAVLAPDSWQVSTATTPDVYSGLIQIGHAREIALDAMGCIGFDLPITAWITEVDDVHNIRDFYTFLSMGDWSLLDFFDTSTFQAIAVPPAAVEQRFQGPNEFLVAEVVPRFSYERDA